MNTRLKTKMVNKEKAIEDALTVGTKMARREEFHDTQISYHEEKGALKIGIHPVGSDDDD